MPSIITYLTSVNYTEYTSTIDTNILNTWSSGFEYTGQILINQVIGEDMSFGQLCYKDATTSSWGLATATTAINKSYSMLGICIETGSTGDATKILTSGYVPINGTYIAYGSNGTPLYMSTTNGNSTNIAPTSSGNVVRLIGYNFLTQTTQANGLNIIYFNPDNTWIELT